MKMLTALSIALFSFSSISAPVFIEGSQKFKNVFPDHENPNKFYFMPEKARPMMTVDEERPLFAVIYSNLLKFGSVQGMFEIEAEKDFYLIQKMFRKEGKELYQMPASSIRYKLTDTAEMLKGVREPLQTNETDGLLGFGATLTEKGLKELPALLMNPETVLFSACYSVEGASPELNANIEINLDVVKYQFEQKKSLTKEKIVKMVDTFILVDWIKVSAVDSNDWGPNYVKAVSDKLIKEMFVQNADKTFSLKNELSNVETSYQLVEASSPTTKELCIDVKSDFVKKYPDVLKNTDAKE